MLFCRLWRQDQYKVIDLSSYSRGLILTRHRLVKMGGNGSLFLDLAPIIHQEFPGYYDKLVNSQPIRCVQTQKTFDGVQKPTAVVLDVGATYLQERLLVHRAFDQFFLLPTLQHIRSVTGKTIPIFTWSTTFAAFTLRVMGLEKFGGFGDVATKAHIQAEATGRILADVIDEVGSDRSCHPKFTTFPPLRYIIPQKEM